MRVNNIKSDIMNNTRVTALKSISIMDDSATPSSYTNEQTVLKQTVLSRIGRVRSNTMYLYFVDNDGNSAMIPCSPQRMKVNNRDNVYAMKVSVTGDKYIGIQQDRYEIVVENLPAPLIANLIKLKKYNMIVMVDDIYDKTDSLIPVFSGQIINVVGGWKDFKTYETKFTCLRKASIFLNSLVNPYSPNSSMNYYQLLSQLLPAESQQNIPIELQDITFNRDDFYINGDRKTILNDIIDMLNERVKDYAWYDITYKPDGTIDIFNSKSQNVKVYKAKGETGMIGVPQIGDNGVTFEHVYQKWIVPGMVVKIDNKYLDTTSATTAYLYTIDPNGEYVITHVKYDFSTLNGQTFKCTCEAFPRSKYNSWSIK